MTTYVALLRAINVGGHSIVRKGDLCSAFSEAGCQCVETFIQSGNVIFAAPPRTLTALVRKARVRLGELLDTVPEIIVRSSSDLAALIARSPFARYEAGPKLKLYVAFLSQTPKPQPSFPLSWPKEGLDLIGSTGPDVFVVSRPKANGMFAFPNKVIEDQLGVAATTRNWNTVTKLAKLLESKS
jgi:uncharacterized protein (DUF1697 family)